MRFGAPEKLTLCFHATKGTRGLDPDRPNLPLRILDQSHTADTSYFYLQGGNLASQIETSLTSDHDLFLTFSSKEGTKFN